MFIRYSLLKNESMVKTMASLKGYDKISNIGG